jgi:hypothetical protein
MECHRNPVLVQHPANNNILDSFTITNIVGVELAGIICCMYCNDLKSEMKQYQQ